MTTWKSVPLGRVRGHFSITIRQKTTQKKSYLMHYTRQTDRRVMMGHRAIHI